MWGLEFPLSAAGSAAINLGEGFHRANYRVPYPSHRAVSSSTATEADPNADLLNVVPWAFLPKLALPAAIGRPPLSAEGVSVRGPRSSSEPCGIRRIPDRRSRAP